MEEGEGEGEGEAVSFVVREEGEEEGWVAIRRSLEDVKELKRS